MKIEMGESLGYSYLRHVKNCWLVQTNWKASEHWEKCVSDEELEAVFRAMRQTFDLGGSVFKGTKDGSQFLRQAEIDVVGVGQDGSVHAIDVAFHEAGLNYGGGVGNRVLKKLLRTVLVLMAYHPLEVQRHIYFVSPKVHRAAQQPLEDIFDRLQGEYPDIGWHLLTNETFATQLLKPTLRAADKVADTSELFLRSIKLLELGGLVDSRNWDEVGPPIYEMPKDSDDSIDVVGEEIGSKDAEESPVGEPGQIQPYVRGLMKTLLEDYPDFLTDEDRQLLMSSAFCEGPMGLQLGGYPLLRSRHEGRMDGDHFRYWEKVYSSRYYVTNNWWKQRHISNSKALLSWVVKLINQNATHPGRPALEQHRAALQGYLLKEGASSQH